MEEVKYESLENPNPSSRPGPLKCNPHIAVEGWILFARNVHPEAQEDDIYDLFADYGKIKNIHLNLDRRTGSNKGYALVQYEDLTSAEDAKQGLNQKAFQGRVLQVDFALKPPS